MSNCENNDRFINVDKVLREFPFRLHHYDKENGNEHFIYGIETVLEYLDETAENKDNFETIIHSYWKTVHFQEDNEEGYPLNRTYYECMNCHYRLTALFEVKSNYCPYCGARMDDKEGD